MPTAIRVTFDGCGLNDRDSEYRARVATFVDSYRWAGEEVERAVNAADAMCAALEVMLREFAPNTLAIRTQEQGTAMEQAHTALRLFKLGKE